MTTIKPTQTLTKTDAIRLYDRLVKADHELVTIAYYLADASDQERARYLSQNPQTAAALAVL